MKNKNTAALLAFFLGGLGVHQFYLGKGGKGILYLIFCITFIPAIIAFIDGIILLTMSEDNFNRKYNYTYLATAPVSQIVNQIHVGNTNSINGSTTEELNKLVELKEKGILSELEFQAQKRKMLS